MRFSLEDAQGQIHRIAEACDGFDPAAADRSAEDAGRGLLIFALGGSPGYRKLNFKEYIPLLFSCEGEQVLHLKGKDPEILREDACLIAGPRFRCELECRDRTYVLGLAVRKDFFWKRYLSSLSLHEELLSLLLGARDGALQVLSDGQDHGLRKLLELMVLIDAESADSSRGVLDNLYLSVLQYLDRQYRAACCVERSEEQRIAEYVADHMSRVSRGEVADAFSYHENTINSRIKAATGLSYVRFLRKKRMERAMLLLSQTGLGTAEIAKLIGYDDSSSFFKAFKGYYGTPPRTLVSGRGAIPSPAESPRAGKSPHR